MNRNINLKKYMEYVEGVLQKYNRDKGKKSPFRSRVNHTKRVLMWAMRLVEEMTDVDKDVLFVAAIFHDIGYATGTPEEHQAVSAQMFEEYAKSEGMDIDFVNVVADAIRIHSDKWRMKNPNDLTIEQILLMEADLLDEEGALAICWDGLSSGYKLFTSYEESLNRTIEKRSEKNDVIFVTAKGKEIFEKKQKFVDEYIKEMKYDLMVPEY